MVVDEGATVPVNLHLWRGQGASGWISGAPLQKFPEVDQ